MSDEITRQVFQSASPKQWQRFKWTGRVLLFIALLLFTALLITFLRDRSPSLPQLQDKNEQYKKIMNLSVPITINTGINQKYRGFRNFLLKRKKQAQTVARFTHVNLKPHQKIRAGFYVLWDPQSYFSLRAHISKMNMVIPEWFTIDSAADTIITHIDNRALSFMRENKVAIVPILSNASAKKGDFDGALLHAILTMPERKKKFINDLVAKLQFYHFQGVNIDFEEITEKSDLPLILFQKDLYTALHAKGLIVTQDVVPGNEDYNYSALEKYNDYLFLMAYDEHSDHSTDGPISSQKWIEAALGEIAKVVPPEKIILCIAGFGYDWPKGDVADDITYQEALSIAKENDAHIHFDADTYNLTFQYTDDNEVLHHVFFTDAATNFNTLRFADEFGVAGTALWRLGGEDSRLWSFYGRNLSSDSLNKKPFTFNGLSTVSVSTDVDYVGEGEILDVLTTPSTGKIKISVDASEMLINGQDYVQLPSMYVIKRYGHKDKKIVLTFDDGPDPTYTPEILKIIQREHVPASFFMVGINAENNIPIVKRIYEEGYEIGNHTFTHPNMALVSTNRAQIEMSATRLLLESITGHSTVMFRAPYNADSEPESIQEIVPVILSKEQNYYTIGESIDPEDWEPGVTASTIVERVKQGSDNGNILLLHDAGGNRWQTVNALPQIIHYFKSKGYQFTTISDLLGKKRDDVMPRVSNQSDFYLIQTNYVLASLGYYGGHLIFSLFLLAIVLGLIKIVVFGNLAYFQKRKTRNERPTQPASRKRVDVIIPAYNEEINAIKTVENLLLSTYKDFTILFIDDGSTDHTYSLVTDRFANHPRIKVVTKKNGGKASALNYGIALSSAEFVVCIDADTQLKPDAIDILMGYFSKSNVAAVAGNVKVGNETTLLTKWQSIEYITSQNFDRRAFDLLNCITVVPGAIGAFRKHAIIEAGGFTSDTLAEDCDLTLRILKNGHVVRNAPDAIAITEAPETLRMFLKQRFRWSFGIMQSFWKNREACFNFKYGALGWIALPNLLIFQILLPIIAPLADVFMILGFVWGNGLQILVYYLSFMIVDAGVAFMAFSFEKEKKSKIWWLIPQRLVYRQIMYYILFKSIKKALKGELQSWGTLERTGNVKALVN